VLRLALIQKRPAVFNLKRNPYSPRQMTNDELRELNKKRRIHQIAWVTRDLEKSMKAWVDNLKVGPWTVLTFTEKTLRYLEIDAESAGGRISNLSSGKSLNKRGGQCFVPAKQMGVVILANKDYPIDDRVTIAHQILVQLDSGDGACDSRRSRGSEAIAIQSVVPRDDGS
jgi:hypothetical protein